MHNCGTRKEVFSDSFVIEKGQTRIFFFVSGVNIYIN